MTKSNTDAGGIDTAKDKLDFTVSGQADVNTVTNAEAGWDDILRRCREAGVVRVGIEATGGYERGVTRHLQKAGLTVVVFQPLQVRAFAQLRLQRAKNDRIDAMLIAACTQMVDAQTRMPPDLRFDPLCDQLTFLEQVEEDIVRSKTRLEHITEPRLKRLVTTDIKRLQARRTREIKRLITSLREHDDLAKRFDLVCSVPSIGERTALALVVRMPELGQVSREEAASLAGLAPFVRQSGKQKGEAHIGGGRSRLRHALFAAALPGAFRWNLALKNLYARLIARGKGHKAALVACARKLLIFANTVVARGEPWKVTPAAA